MSESHSTLGTTLSVCIHVVCVYGVCVHMCVGCEMYIHVVCMSVCACL